MPRPHTKRRVSRIIYSKPVVIILLIIAVFAVHSAWSAYEKMSESYERVASIEERKTKLQEKKQTLNEQLERLETEKGVEEQLREKYSVTKEGERMVVIVENEERRDTSSEPERSWWASAWYAVTSIFR